MTPPPSGRDCPVCKTPNMRLVDEALGLRYHNLDTGKLTLTVVVDLYCCETVKALEASLAESERLRDLNVREITRLQTEVFKFEVENTRLKEDAEARSNSPSIVLLRDKNEEIKHLRDLLRKEADKKSGFAAETELLKRCLSEAEKIAVRLLEDINHERPQITHSYYATVLRTRVGELRGALCGGEPAEFDAVAFMKSLSGEDLRKLLKVTTLITDPLGQALIKEALKDEEGVRLPNDTSGLIDVKNPQPIFPVPVGRNMWQDNILKPSPKKEETEK